VKSIYGIRIGTEDRFHAGSPFAESSQGSYGAAIGGYLVTHEIIATKK